MWFKVLSELKLRHRKIPRDVANRWNSTYQLLRFALLYREAISQMTERNRELHDLQIEDEEWGLLEQLKTLLEVCTAMVPCAHCLIAVKGVQSGD